MARDPCASGFGDSTAWVRTAYSLHKLPGVCSGVQTGSSTARGDRSFVSKLVPCERCRILNSAARSPDTASPAIRRFFQAAC